MMALSQWRSTELRRDNGKVRAKEKTKAKANMVAGNLVSGALAVDVDVEEMVKEKERKEKERIKEKEKGSQRTTRAKGSRKENFNPTSALYAVALGIGEVTVLIRISPWK